MFELAHEVGSADARRSRRAGVAGIGEVARARALGHDPGIRGHHVPRGDGEERAQFGARGRANAVRVDRQPVSRLLARVRLLLRAAVAPVPRPRRGPRFRHPGDRQDQRRRAAATRARAAHRGAASRSRSAPTPTRTSAPRVATNSCPASSTRSRSPERRSASSPRAR